MDNTNEKKNSIMDDEGFVGFVNFVTEQFSGIREEIKESSNKLATRIDNLENEVNIIKTTMVTKSFLTDKMADFKVETDGKIDTTIDILKEKKIFDDEDVMRIKKPHAVPVVK